MSANPAIDVLEEAINGSLHEDLNIIINDCTPIALAVATAIQTMTPEQQRELIEP